MEAAAIQKMIKPLSDSQRGILLQLIDATRACSDWEEARARLSAKTDIEKAKSLTNLRPTTAERIVLIADKLLQAGNLTDEGVTILDPVITALRKQLEA